MVLDGFTSEQRFVDVVPIREDPSGTIHTF